MKGLTMKKTDQEDTGRLPPLTHSQWTALVVLRVLIGWHFLYEGIVKILNPYWSSAGYLVESQWILSGFFKSIVANPTVLKFVDLLNEWGLVLIGTVLIAGCFTRVSSIAGIVVLLLYYVCNPPLIGFTSSVPSEGSYLIVNKNLIELAALFVLLLFPTGRVMGLDVLMSKIKK